ncbi:hypothetical protein C8Q76DRAFT_713304 [Earliella scabrosa]|nr:hypothetical protein C8Q76DRAFT_713304 [Earliella scabrosa]
MDSGVVSPRLGCVGSSSISAKTLRGYGSLSISSRSSLILSDILLIAVTWVTLCRHRAEGSFRKHSLLYILVRDGAIYFACLLMLNLMHLLFTLLSIAKTATQAASDITIFTEPMTAILMSRFMLDLQAVDYRSRRLHSQVGTLDETRSDFSGAGSGAGAGSLVFQGVLGSLGSSVLSDDRRAGSDLGDDIEVA